MSVEVGQRAEEMSLTSSSGEQVKLSDYRGRYVVLYFYPKDNTPTCTTEACDFRDAFNSFQELNAVIVGVSVNNLKEHRKFIEKYDLPFELLVDEEHRLSEQFGVWQLKKMYGKEYMGIVRSTFVLDPEGILIKEWRKVTVKGHVQEALEYIRSLA